MIAGLATVFDWPRTCHSSRARSFSATRSRRRRASRPTARAWPTSPRRTRACSTSGCAPSARATTPRSPTTPTAASASTSGPRTASTCSTCRTSTATRISTSTRSTSTSKVVRDLTPFQGDPRQRHHARQEVSQRDAGRPEPARPPRLRHVPRRPDQRRHDAGHREPGRRRWAGSPTPISRSAPPRPRTPRTPRRSCACATAATPPWRDLLTLPFGENGGIDDFSADGKALYVETSVGADTTRLVKVDIASGKELETIAKDPKVDVGDVIIHPDTRQVQAVGFNYLKNEWRVLDPAIKADFEALAKIGRGEFYPSRPRPRRQELARHLPGRRRPGGLVRLQPRHARRPSCCSSTSPTWPSTRWPRWSRWSSRPATASSWSAT